MGAAEAEKIPSAAEKVAGEENAGNGGGGF